jgi:type I restriction enzyme S subunit
MITGLKPYPKMKDSGVPWLGDVPENWGVFRADIFLKPWRRAIHPQQIAHQNVLHYSIPSVQRLASGMVEAGSSIDSTKLLIDRTLLLVSKLNPRKGTVMLAEPHSVLTTVASSEFVAMYPARCLGEYARYLYSSEHVRFELSARVESATKSHQRCSPEDITKLQIPVPPLLEQTAIVRFLEYADRRIRRYIQAKQKLIKLLEEQKKAIIHRAVTGQIDVRTGQPYPAYKPSGVEWLGDVPEHWGVSAVRQQYEIKLGKMLQNRLENPEDVEVLYLKAQHVQWFSVRTSSLPKMWASPRDLIQFGIKSGDLLVCEGGEGGRAGIIGHVPTDLIIQNALHRVRPFANSSNEYLQYIMRAISATGWFDAINNKATIAHFTREKFGALKIPSPPLLEQTAIAHFLDQMTADIASTIDSTTREITLLREYRTRLIADVVTGKLDVREAAASLPDELEEPDLLEELPLDGEGDEAANEEEE